jgi:hypothetical protein
MLVGACMSNGSGYLRVKRVWRVMPRPGKALFVCSLSGVNGFSKRHYRPLL